MTGTLEILKVIDQRRQSLELKKAELARAIGAKPANIRKLFSNPKPNVKLATLFDLMEALGLRLTCTEARDPKAFMRFVKARCDEHGLTIGKLGKLAGVDASNLKRTFEAANPCPRMSLVQKVAEVLEISIAVVARDGAPRCFDEPNRTVYPDAVKRYPCERFGGGLAAMTDDRCQSPEETRAVVTATANALTREIYTLASGFFSSPSQPMTEYVHAMQTRVQRLRTIAITGVDVARELEARTAQFDASARRCINRLLWLETLMGARVRLHSERETRPTTVLRDLLRVMCHVVVGRQIEKDLTGNRKQLISALSEYDGCPSTIRRFDELRHFGPALDYLVENGLLAKRCGRESVTLCFGAVELIPPAEWVETSRVPAK